jgi:rhodanese-related sulfurtransferase
MLRERPRPAAAHALWLALLALVAVALAGCGGSADEGASAAVAGGSPAVSLVSPEGAQEIIDNGGVILLDVRTPEEFAAARLEGAENIDFHAPDFASRLDALDHAARYVVYCRSGNRSGQATALMAEKGFTDVTDVDGGIAAWEAAGRPTVGGDG